MVFYHNIDPVLLHLGPFEIRYYGLIFVLGALIAYFMLIHFSKKGLLDFNKDEISTMLVYLLSGILISSRLFYVIFYNLKYFISNPLEILFIWQGGLSFHGGLVGAIVGGLLFWRKRKFNFWEVADFCVIPLGLILGIGRIGNFINGELYGRLTSLPWGVKFPNAEGFRHPSQLYEAGKNFLIFGTLWFLKDKKLPKGFLFWTFVSMYGILRFLIEFVREPDPQLGFIIFNLTMGQLFCLAMIVIGIFMLVKLKRKYFYRK